MRILQARFIGACVSNSGASKAGTMVIVDDDCDSDDAIDAKASVLEQEGIRDIGDAGEDLDEDNYYNHDEDTYVCHVAIQRRQMTWIPLTGFLVTSYATLASSRYSTYLVLHARIELVLNIYRAYFLSILYILSCCFSLYHILPLFHRLLTPSRVQTLLLLLLVLRRMLERYPSFASHVLLKFA